MPPAAIADKKKPSVSGAPPKRASLSAGKSATGIASVMAARSVSSDPRKGGRRQITRSPAITLPTSSAPPGAGRSAGAQQPAEGQEEGEGADRVAAPGHAPNAGNDPPEGRPTQHRRLEARMGERDARALLLAREEVRDHRLARRLAKREAPRLGGREREKERRRAPPRCDLRDEGRARRGSFRDWRFRIRRRRSCVSAKRLPTTRTPPSALQRTARLRPSSRASPSSPTSDKAPRRREPARRSPAISCLPRDGGRPGHGAAG